MKTLKNTLPKLMAIVAALPAIVGAQEVTPKLPPECEALTKQYLHDTETATKPITARYVSGLQALAVAATKKGDLASALAIQSELARFSAVGRWRFQSNNATETRELHPNGTFTTATGRKDLRGTWSVEPAGLVLRYSGGGTETFPVPFDPSGTKGHSTGNFDVTISKLSTQ